MVKTLIPQNIASISSIRFQIDKQGNLSKIEVMCEVNYGTMGLNQTVDILPELTSGQKASAQAFYNNLKTKLDAIILG